MPAADFLFCGPTFQSRDGLWAAERAVNLYPEVDPAGRAKSKVALMGTPGLSVFATLPKTPVRGLWAGEGRLFAVGDDTLYEIDSAGSASARPGAMLGATTPVQISGNYNSLFVVDGNKGYLDDGATVTEVVDTVSGCFLDGYFVGLEPDTNNVIISGLFDGSTWDALDTQTKMGSLDRIMRVVAHNGQLWLFGSKTIEVWYHSGAADYPFERISGASIDVGTVTAWSIAAVDGTLLWLGSDERGVGVVYQSQGYTPKRVSNSAIEYFIESYRAASATIDPNITGYCYQEDGHTFYVLNFPAASATLAYDLTTGMWHERSFYNSGTGVYQQSHGGSFHAFAFGKHLVASIGYNSGKIYQQSLDIFTDDSGSIRRYRRAPYVSTDQQYLFHSQVRFHTLSTSTVNFRYLKDDGTTWSATKTATPANHECEFRRLGRARDRLYEAWIDNGTARQGFIGAWLSATSGVER
jgi:hypothetical protein